jgi:nicotinamidase-related amidase
MTLQTLAADSCVLTVVDLQGRLAELMWRRESLLRELDRLIRGCRLLQVPVLWLEQVPEKLGPTVAEIRQALEGCRPISKSTFSGFGCGEFRQELAKTGRSTLILAGIEAHVCVYQTALDALADGYRVEVVGDAVSSRTESNLRFALQRLRDAGAGVSSTEMLLFELQRMADGDTFRALSKLVK